MSKPHLVKSKLASTQESKKRNSVVMVVLVLLLVNLGMLGAWWWHSRRSPAQPPAASTAPDINAAPASTSSAATASPPASQAAPEYQKLKDRWLRPDGGYVIDIRSVGEDGALDAGYFNPKPIHVAKAQASQDGATLKVFIELRDVNYPGSTYTLAYDAATDQLQGIYFQALQQQSFEVYFQRMK